MTVVFPKNNLPEPAQPWAREVQKQLANVIASDRANEVNNAARDNQLNSSLISLTKVVSDVKIASDKSTDALDGLLGLGSTGSDYTLNASNIVGGTITGVILQSAASGQRVVVSGTEINLYNSSNQLSGAINGTSLSGNPSLEISNSNTSMYMDLNRVLINSGGSPSGADLVLTPSSTGLSCAGTTSLSGNSIIILSSNNVDVQGIVIANNGIQSSNIPANLLGGGAIDVYASSSLGRLGYISSSRDTKQEISDIEIDINAVLSIKPKQFKYNVDIDEFGIENAPIETGFIAEDLDEVGLGRFVQRGADGQIKTIPYSKYVVALQAVVRNLNDRITALENGA